MNAVINMSYNTGYIGGEKCWDCGGIAGNSSTDSDICNSYNAGAVGGKDADGLGGIAGKTPEK